MLQAQSEDDDTGPDDVAVTVEAQDGYMEAFFAEVQSSCAMLNDSYIHTLVLDASVAINLCESAQTHSGCQLKQPSSS